MASEDTKGGVRWYHVVLIAVVMFGVGLVWLAVSSVLDRSVQMGRETSARDQLRSLFLMLAERKPAEGAADGEVLRGLHGKNVVLSLVADGSLEVDNPDHLAFLFRPGGVPEDIGPDDYAEVTLEALRERRFPRLTHVLGPARRMSVSSLTGTQEGAPAAVLGLPLKHGLVVVLSGGDVRFFPLVDAEDMSASEGLRGSLELAEAMGLSAE